MLAQESRSLSVSWGKLPHVFDMIAEDCRERGLPLPEDAATVVT